MEKYVEVDGSYLYLGRNCVILHNELTVIIYIYDTQSPIEEWVSVDTKEGRWVEFKDNFEIGNRPDLEDDLHTMEMFQRENGFIHTDDAI